MRTLLFVLVVFVVSSVAADPRPSNPVRFIENKGQWPSPFRFACEKGQGKIFFSSDRVVVSLRQMRPHLTEAKSIRQIHRKFAELQNGDKTVSGHVYQMEFVNSNPLATVSGNDDTGTRYHYLRGNDPAKWVQHARGFHEVFYSGIYNGVDMRYYSQGDYLKYEWIVGAQVDPSLIQIKYDGVDEMDIVDDNLLIRTSLGEITELRPIAYQWRDGQKVNVNCQFLLKGTTLSYSFPQGYDECLELVIDPILIFSAYSGSSADNWGNTATYDARGNVYSGGMVEALTDDLEYPVTPGAYETTFGGGAWDVGILKFDSAGSKLLYCTLLGGDNTETPQSLVTNSKGELLILGATGSSNFPVTNGSTFKGGESIEAIDGIPYSDGSDLFVTRLSEDGSTLLGSTFLGGSANDGINMESGVGVFRIPTPLTKNYGDQLRGDVICDSDDNVYIVSNTRSADFPAMNSFGGGSHDGILVSLSSDLSQLLWSRFIGGTGVDAAYSVRLDLNEKLYVAGGTTSPSIAGMTGLHTTSRGGVDGWIMSFTDQGLPVNGTYLGTNSYDQSYFIDVNGAGEVYAYGQTTGSYAAGQSGNLFVHKLNSDLSATQWVRIIGPGVISPTAFLVSDCGYIYVSGWGGLINNLENYYIGGTSTGLPTTPDAFKKQSTANDFYLLVMSADGLQNLYGTFFGGSTSLTHVDGGTSRFDKNGIVYHAVCASCGGEDDFPSHNVPDAFAHNGSTNCNNAVFKFDLSLLKARIQSNSTRLDDPGLSSVCIPQPIAFENLTSGGETYYWDLGDGTKRVKTDRDTVVHHYKTPGTYRVWLKAVDERTCTVKDSTSTVVHVYTGTFNVSDDKTICANVPEQLQASGADQFLWTSDDGSFTSTLPSPWVTIKKDMDFYVTMTTSDGCVEKDTVSLKAITPPTPDFVLEVNGACFGLPTIKADNLTDSLDAADLIFFDFGDGTTSDLEKVTHTYEASGDYNVKVVVARDFCVLEKSQPIKVRAFKIPNVITPEATESKNDAFRIQAGNDPSQTPAMLGLKVDLVIYNRWGKEVFSASNYQNDWKAENLDNGVYYYEVEIQDYASCKGWLHVIK